MCLRIVKGSYGVRTYADSFVRNFPTVPKSQDKTQVELIIGEISTTYLAERLQGGQRLVLPDEATEAIIAALANDSPITLICGFSPLELAPLGFVDACKQAAITPKI